MLQLLSHNSKELKTVSSEEIVSQDAIWYDLVCPTTNELKSVEDVLNIHIPTPEEMSEIEESSRLYKEDGVYYMTSVLISSADSANPLNIPTAFILTSKHLVTVRYAELKSFKNFAKKIAKNGFVTPQTLFVGLMDTVVERIADILEMNALEIDEISKNVFSISRPGDQDKMHNILLAIGKVGTLNSKTRESLITLDRQLNFYRSHFPDDNDKQLVIDIQSVQKDVEALENHVGFLFSKIEFLLEATLGFVNIDQNAIIKFFSVAAVVFLPPMVIASIYGMNFAHIPELNWTWGYPLAILLMILSAILPYYYFKKKRWL